VTMSSNDAAIATAVAIEGAESLLAVQQAARTFDASFGYDRIVRFSDSSAQEDVLDRTYPHCPVFPSQLCALHFLGITTPFWRPQL